jgi:hypothetical protein
MSSRVSGPFQRIRRPAVDCRRCQALALLDHMRQLMRQQPITARSIGGIRTRAKHQVLAHRERVSIEPGGDRVRGRAGVHPDGRKIPSERAFQTSAGAWRQRGSATRRRPLYLLL